VAALAAVTGVVVTQANAAASRKKVVSRATCSAVSRWYCGARCDAGRYSPLTRS